MAPPFHEFQLKLFITRWLYVLSIVVVVVATLVQDGSSHNSSRSSLELIMNKSILIRADGTASTFRSETKHDSLSSGNNSTTTVGNSWEIPDISHSPSSLLRQKRRKMMKRSNNNNDAVVILKAQLYSVCSKKFVQIQGTQVNALAAPESPLARLEIISEPRPTSVNFELTSFQRRHSDDQRRRRRRRRQRRYSSDQDSMSFYVKIRSSASHRYICFNKIGNIISKISGQNPKCRMTEVSHNGALYYYSAVNSSWFIQFNHRGHRIKHDDDDNNNSSNSNNNNTRDGTLIQVHLQENISEFSLPTNVTTNCSDCSSVSTPSLSSSTSVSSSTSLLSSPSSLSSPLTTSTSLTIESSSSSSPSLATSDDSGLASSDRRRHTRHYPKYSKCQGFIKVPLGSSTSPPSLNFKSVK